MKAQRLSSSCTAPLYRITFDNPEEAKASPDELYNFAEAFNYGGSIQSRNDQAATFTVYVD